MAVTDVCCSWHGPPCWQRSVWDCRTAMTLKWPRCVWRASDAPSGSLVSSTCRSANLLHTLKLNVISPETSAFLVARWLSALSVYL